MSSNEKVSEMLFSSVSKGNMNFLENKTLLMFCLIILILKSYFSFNALLAGTGNDACWLFSWNVSSSASKNCSGSWGLNNWLHLKESKYFTLMVQLCTVQDAKLKSDIFLQFSDSYLQDCAFSVAWGFLGAFFCL